MQTKFLISLLVILLSILTVKNTWDFYFSASNNSLNNILRKSVIEQSEKNIELLEKNKNLENEIRSMQNNIGFAESYSRENLDMVFPNEILVEINQKLIRMSNFVVIIPAAGIGERFKSKLPKQYTSIGDSSILEKKRYLSFFRKTI